MTRRTAKRPWSLLLVQQAPQLASKDTWPDTWEAAGLELWNVYASYRAQTKEPSSDRGDRFLVPTAGKLEVMFALSLWCRSKNLDPHLWIYAVFAAMQWRSPTPGHLFSEAFIKHYRTWEGENRDVHHGAQLQARLGESDSTVNDATERVKQGFLSRGAADLCSISPELHGGYSASSSVCRGCSIATKCAHQ